MNASAIKSEFAKRLEEICDDMGIPEGGRQTKLASQFEVVPNTARKWLLGIGLPELEMCMRIAKWADVNLLWLLQGGGLKKGEKIDKEAQALKQLIDEMPGESRQASFDFIGYQLTRADGFIRPDKVSEYMKLLDKLKANPPKGEK